jgi:ABC-type transporter MlaC component
MRTNNSRVTNTYHAAAAVSPRVRFDFVTLVLGFVLTAAVCIFTAASVVQGSTGGDPMTMVKNTVNQVMGILKDHQTSQEVRRRRLIQVVAGHFDFADMARSSMGYHWRQLRSDQRSSGLFRFLLRSWKTHT